jgi:hypothetical protein
LNNKIEIATQGGGDGDGQSGLSQQPTRKVTTQINTMVSQRSAKQVSLVLIVVFSFDLVI